jgi:hypothetical protein
MEPWKPAIFSNETAPDVCEDFPNLVAGGAVAAAATQEVRLCCPGGPFLSAGRDVRITRVSVGPIAEGLNRIRVQPPKIGHS